MNESYALALDIFIESVIRPDEDLRSSARDQNCLDELMNIRQDVLEYLYEIRRRNDGAIPVRPRRAD